MSRFFNDLGVNLAVGTTPTGALHVRPKSDSVVVNVDGLSGHTANLQEWKVNAVVVASMSAAGALSTAVQVATYSAKGAIVAGTGVGTVANVGAIGANGTVLMADSAQATGMKWGTVAGGSSSISRTFLMMGA